MKAQANPAPVRSVPTAGPSGAAASQHANEWGASEMVGSFESKLTPLFLLAKLTMEAHGEVVPSALPMCLELAYMISDLEAEWESFADVFRGISDPA